MDEQLSYPEDGNARCLAIEDSSFWFRHRNRCIVAAVSRYRPAGAIIDVGGGNGYVSRGLKQAGFTPILVEPGPHGAAAASQRGIERVIQGTLGDAGFAEGSVAAAGLFDVLEHIERDDEMLLTLFNLLRPGGWLYLTVPAYQFLFSAVDHFSGHFRRYTCRSLTDGLRGAGFDMCYATYFFAPLVPPIFLRRAVSSWLRQNPADIPPTDDSEHRVAGPQAAILDKLLSWEAHRIERGLRVPFGSSCLVVGRKPVPA
ncbi:MAG TPA: methyltransferase domain-containing protein [Stellaceae bacterium]|nr:methyltransferase domain-containing protein [Stellaceae bacterium]